MEKGVSATGLKFFDFIRPRDGKTSSVEVSCRELFEAAQELQIRELCFWACVNIVANAVGRCDFRTYVDGKENKGREHYLWNFEPNANQNSTTFLHKMIGLLFRNNESLIVSTRGRDGLDSLYVADSWSEPDRNVIRPNVYTDVTVDGFTFKKSFKESDVLRLRLNHVNMFPIVNGVYQAYYRMLRAAMQTYSWNNGQHWKVHVSQIAQSGEGWSENFAKMIEDQIKPFINSDGAILPEFDGYDYTKITTGEQSAAAATTRDVRAMIDDILAFTARAFGIPSVLINGSVEETGDAENRLMSYCVDPICDQLQEEITRKRYGYDAWQAGNYLMVDSSSIRHFDFYNSAASIEKLIGSGAYSINDVRKVSGQPVIREPWADEHMITRNFATMDEAVRKAET